MLVAAGSLSLYRIASRFFFYLGFNVFRIDREPHSFDAVPFRGGTSPVGGEAQWPNDGGRVQLEPLEHPRTPWFDISPVGLFFQRSAEWAASRSTPASDHPCITSHVCALTWLGVGLARCGCYILLACVWGFSSGLARRDWKCPTASGIAMEGCSMMLYICSRPPRL